MAFFFCFAAQFLSDSHPAHGHAALGLLILMVVRLVAHGDLLGPDLLTQLPVYAVPHRSDGRYGILLKNPAQVVEQLGGREEHIRAVIVTEMLQEELGVFVSL